MEKVMSQSASVKRLRYGKFKGCEFSDLPTEYLRELIGSAGATIDDCKEELTRRGMQFSWWYEPEAARLWIYPLIDAGERELLAAHPGEAGKIRLTAHALRQTWRMVREYVEFWTVCK